MEQRVTDPKITHVLVVSDKSYAEKADKREKGVGTESQIISEEVYKKVKQEKFIPIVCEFFDEDSPCLPVFLKSRIWIDFSTLEAVNANWERLIRLLYGKPLHSKPHLGAPPGFLSQETSAPSTPVRSKLMTLQQAILNGRPGIKTYRDDFIATTVSIVDQLRVRKSPGDVDLAEKAIEDCNRLIPIRDAIVDWVLLEAHADRTDDFENALHLLLEKLYALRSRPPEISTWTEEWYEGHKLFVLQTFLYVVASLLRSRAFGTLHEIYFSHYLVPQWEQGRSRNFVRCFEFYAFSRIINSALTTDDTRFLSPAAELFRRQATRSDIPFEDLIQADLLTFLLALISSGENWYPQLMHYAGFERSLEFFIRATRHKHYQELAIITGIKKSEDLRVAARAGLERFRVDRWHDFRFGCDFETSLNLKNLDTIT